MPKLSHETPDEASHFLTSATNILSIHPRILNLLPVLFVCLFGFILTMF